MAKRNVPSEMQPVLIEITGLTDAFCREHLNEEYADICRRLAAALGRKRPSPLLQGQPRTWAAGIIYAAGWINFLSDPSQTPHMATKELAEKIGVGASTMQAKKKVIADALDLMPMDPAYTVSSMIAENPLAWMIDVNGVIMDARYAPREVQEIAYKKGLIPFIPGEDQQTADESTDRPTIIEFPKKRRTSPEPEAKKSRKDEGPGLFDSLEP